MSDTPASDRVNALAERLRDQLRVPLSTYRVQLNASFTFDMLRALVPYLDALGVDTCYLSPCLEARPGSSHGYDIVDHRRFNPELGDADSFAALAGELRQRGMGLMFDVVPNHMSLDSVRNRQWRDVLENGQSAAAAAWFDIDWQPVKDELQNKVLLPILGDQYGLVLERGELQVARREGGLVVRYFEHELPIDPGQIPLAIAPEVEAHRSSTPHDDPDTRELLSVMTAFGNLPAHVERDPARREERQRESQVASDRFAALEARAPAIGALVDRAIARLNGTADRLRQGYGESAEAQRAKAEAVPSTGDSPVAGPAGSGQNPPEAFDALHALLERQPYRLAYWRTALDEINYRRFFDIIELGAVRVEDPDVFTEAHRLVLDLVRDGLVTAIRLDHPDGLYDPEAYFERLQAAAWNARVQALHVDDETTRALADWRDAQRKQDEGHWAARPLYLAAEKILVPGERFRPGWAIHGGVGYLFLNQVNGLFVDRAGLHQLERLWSRMNGPTEFAEIAYECRSLIARTALASEMNMLAHALERIVARDRRSRDFTLNSLRKVLREVVACFPVYRTYVTERGASEHDRLVIARAVAEARQRSPVMEASIFEFIEEVLGGSLEPPDPDRLRFAMRFQQITGPVQAKGMEDTAFYRYCPLLGINEVGSDPANPSLGVDQFHDANRVRVTDWPVSMLALATHDTKRSGDARARLATLTERPDDWRRAVANWMRLNARHRSVVSGEAAPDRADEYHFYQALLAIWPAEAESDPVPTYATADVQARVSAYMVKAIREAKLQSSWLRPNPAYEDAMTTFVRTVLTGPGSSRFLSRFVPFARSVARPAAAASLAQLVLQMGSPGVPDVYQGSELWDLHLVDPDNRQPVDFDHRRACLTDLLPALERVENGEDAMDVVRGLGEQWTDGRVKLWVMAALLRYRRRHADLFLSGDYAPMTAEHAPIVAFARTHGSQSVIVLAARHASRLTRDRGWALSSAWRNLLLPLPPPLEGRRWRDPLTGRGIETTRGDDGREQVPLATVFDPLPVAWLVSRDDGPA